MNSTSDTPLKRFSAFWLALALFVLFGLIALVFATLPSEDEATAADKANAERRLAILATVNEIQAEGLAPSESENTKQVPPREAFEVVALQLLNKKPVAVRDERQRDPAAASAESAQEPEESDATAVEPAASPSASETEPAETQPADEQDQPSDSPA